MIFADLINRISGKNDVIKGINRNSKGHSDVKANFLKVLNFFKQAERFNARYLWSL